MIDAVGILNRIASAAPAAGAATREARGQPQGCCAAGRLDSLSAPQHSLELQESESLWRIDAVRGAPGGEDEAKRNYCHSLAAATKDDRDAQPFRFQLSPALSRWNPFVSGGC